MGEAALVVDFGTSASSAALVDGGRVRLLKEPASGLYSWPSAVSADGERLLVGTAAERRKRADPGGYRAEFKRDLGQSAPVPLGDRAYAPQDLVAAVLGVFRDRAAEMHGGPVHRLLLTVPASYGEGDPRRALMVAAGEAAGFPEVQLVAEPVAAAFAPVAGDEFAAGQVVLVYDFGGGTFDAALIRCGADGVHEVIGHAALDDCGGRDVDALLARHVRETGGAELASTMSAGGLPGLRMRLQLGDFVRGVKHQLTDADTVEDFVTPVAPPYRLDRAELSALVAPLLERTVDCCRDLLRRCGVDPRGLTAVLLVGGTSRMPAVRDTVAGALRVRARWAEDPELAVVQGAAALAGQDGARRVAAEPPPSGEVPLRWELPGGTATVLRWLTAPGAAYDGGADLVVVRARDGLLWTLIAPEQPGTLLRVHAPAGTVAASGDWLATTAPIAAPEEPPPAGLTLLDAPRQLWSLNVIGAERVAFSADGRWLMGNDVDDGIVFDPFTGAVRTRVRHKGAVKGIGVSAAGDAILTGDNEGRVTVWDGATGQRRLRVRAGDDANDVALSPDGRWIVAAYSEGWPSDIGYSEDVTVWDAATGSRLRDLPHDNEVECLAFSADGTRLATGDETRFATVWDPHTGERLLRLKHKDCITSVSFSADGTRLVTASDRSATVWDLATGERLLQVRHADRVKAAALSPDGRWLATAGDDKKATLWDAATGAPLRTLDAAGAVALAFHPDGRHLAVTGNKLRVWEIAELR